MKENVDNIFSYGVGTYLITAALNDVTVWPAILWGLTILILISAYVTVTRFGSHGLFWRAALSRLDIYGPKGERHQAALDAFDISKEIVKPFGRPILFFLSFGASMTLMAGLLMQGWYVPMVAEAAASAVGFGFIHYFQVNKFNILGQITGTDEATP